MLIASIHTISPQNYKILFSPFLTVFGLQRLRTAIRLVRFGYGTFTECVV